MAPIREELSQSPEEHVAFLVIVLGVFGFSRDNVEALIGDKANTYRALARKFRVLFIGCHSHKFKIAMKEMLLKRDKIEEKVNMLMGNFSHSILAALLRRKTPLSAKRCKTT